MVAKTSNPAELTPAFELPRARLPALFGNVLVGVFYFLLARFGLHFATVGNHVSPVWPPSGFSIAVLLLAGPRLAGGVFLGSFAANFGIPSPPGVALAIGVGNTLEALVAFWLFARGQRVTRAPDRLGEVFRFLLLGAVVPACVSALFGVTSLCVAGLNPWANYLLAFRTWAIGNLLGACVGTPVLLALARREFPEWSGRRRVEAAALAGGLALVSYLIFVRGWENPYTDAPLVFTPFPFLIWAALRFGMTGAACSNLLVATIATIATAQARGPFSAGSFADNVWLLQMFIAVTSVATLLIAATVAERRQSEAALRQSEAQLQMALDAARLGIWSWEIPTGKITWSEGIANLYGMRLTDFDGTIDAVFQRVYPDDREALRRKITRTLEDREPFHVEHRVVWPDGSLRWVRAVGDVLRDPTGKPLRLSGVAMDITEHRAAEKLNARLGRILDSSLNEIYVFEAATLRFLSVNEGARKNLGHSLDELKRLTPLDLNPRLTAESFAQLTAPLRSGAETLVVFETVHRRKDGTEYPIEARLLLSRDETPPVHVAIIQDTTQRQRAEAEKLQFERRLQESQKLESLGILAGGIAHDFNNLLTGILGNVTLSRMALTRSTDPNPLLDQVEATALRAAELCKQMLAYSGKGRFVTQRLDLSALVVDSAPLLQLSISKKARLRLHLAPTPPPAHADATQMQQILMNLVINASDAIGDRPGNIDLTTGVLHADTELLRATHLAPELPAGEYVYLEVADDGCGMSAETVARIFDPFFTTKFTGRGLGLAAVLGIVRGHQGALQVTSELGRGTTFRLLLPRTAGAPEEFRSPAGVATSWNGSGTILIVDDEESVRLVCAGLVEMFGFQTLTATDGREAVEIFTEQGAQIDLVLLDLTMPHLDGEETFREMRRLNPTARVLLMSGFNEQEVTARFTTPGLGGFLQKPFQPEQLRAKLRELLESPAIL